MAGHDELIHQQLRLKIMATLNTLPAPASIEFSRLRAVLAATDGNLGAHLNILEGAGYIIVEKDFVKKSGNLAQVIYNDDCDTHVGRQIF